MPLCGFNEKIFGALDDLRDGLLLQAEKHTKERGASTTEVFESEVVEMNIFLSALQELSADDLSGDFDPEMRDMLVGLTMLVRPWYKEALERSRTDGVSIEDAFTSTQKEASSFFSALDNQYYEVLRPEHSIEESMKRLIEWTRNYQK